MSHTVGESRRIQLSGGIAPLVYLSNQQKRTESWNGHSVSEYTEDALAEYRKLNLGFHSAVQYRMPVGENVALVIGPRAEVVPFWPC